MVTPGAIQSLFDQLFGERDADAAHAARAAVIAALLDSQDGGDALDTAQMAAYLDAGLDEAGRAAFDARLVASAAALHDLIGAADLLARVEAQAMTAPAELVAATQAPRRRIRAIPAWTGTVLALAVAAAIAAVMVMRQPPPPATPGQPVTATAVPSAPPAMVPAASLDTMPAPGGDKPKLAPEGFDAAPGATRPGR